MARAVRHTLGQAARRVTSKVVRDALAAGREHTATDLVVGSILARTDLPPRSDPTSFATFLRDCFGPVRFRAIEIRARDGETTAATLRFHTLVEQLGAGPPPIPESEAIRIGLLADELVARREPFERPHWAGDVGLHARLASSFGRKGRLLWAIARFSGAAKAIEIGTAYGLSALFLGAALGRDGRIATLERSEPQLSIARELLGREHPDSVDVIGGISTDAVSALGDRFRGSDFLFHDAEHSRQAYIDDFEAFQPLLRSGAAVLYDDIRWEDPWSSVPARTYEGWQAVAAHPRVRRAVEVDGEFGLLLLD